MSRVIPLALWLLLAVWLPATMHCQIEAGLGTPDGDSCCANDSAAATGDDCLGDGCVNIEDSLFKDPVPEPYLAAPAAICDFCCGVLARVIRIEPILSPQRHAPPLELKAAWQFLERAAPPARAPSLNT